MYQVAIVESESEERTRIAKLLRQCVQQLRIEDCNISPFSTTSALCTELRWGSYYDLVFMDVHLGAESGIESARELISQRPNMRFVFFASTYHHLASCLIVRPVDYLLRPIDSSRLVKVIWRDYKDHYLARSIFVLKERKRKIAVPFSEILYCDHYYGKTKIRTLNQVFETRTKLTELMARLNSALFVHCHESYLVNLSYVRAIEKDHFVMRNGSVVDISRGRYSATLQAFTSYISNHKRLY